MIGTMLLEETPSRIEPCLLDEVGPEIVDLVASVSAASSNLGKRLHPRSAESLADLVRVMNCYYSNLIEGHNTTPREIQQALQNRLEATEERRNLQIEARAHIRVQQDVDRLYAAGKLPEPASVAFILWLHRSFYQNGAGYIQNQSRS
jgi:Fic family protein